MFVYGGKFQLDVTLLFIIGGASAIGFYMAWSIGANDVANSMATAVGAKAITFKQAVLIAGILSFAGAVLLGPHVAETVKGKIVNTEMIADPQILLLGFIASLLAAALWVTLATWKSMPVSTTHSIIGALMGFGIIAGGILFDDLILIEVYPEMYAPINCRNKYV